MVWHAERIEYDIKTGTRIPELAIYVNVYAYFIRLMRFPIVAISVNLTSPPHLLPFPMLLSFCVSGWDM